METTQKTIELNGKLRLVECIAPFFQNNYYMRPKPNICQINVTPEKYSPIFYNATVGEALVDFYTLKSYRYKEPIEISSVIKYSTPLDPEPITLSDFSLKLLSKVDTANCTVLAHLIDFYNDSEPDRFKDEFSRAEAEKLVTDDLYDLLLDGGYPIELLPYSFTLCSINEYNDNDFYYIAACLYARCEVKYPFLNKICSLIEQDYNTIEVIDIDALQLKYDAINKESGIVLNDFSKIKIIDKET